jgi:hypothetical protein
MVSSPFCSFQSYGRICHNNVTEKLSDKRPEDDTPHVGSKDAKRDGDGGTEDGEEGENIVKK